MCFRPLFYWSEFHNRVLLIFRAHCCTVDSIAAPVPDEDALEIKQVIGLLPPNCTVYTKWLSANVVCLFSFHLGSESDYVARLGDDDTQTMAGIEKKGLSSMH